jgi:hypothetical protein
LLEGLRLVRLGVLDERLRLINADIAQLGREAELGQRPPLSEQELRALDARYGLVVDDRGGKPDLAGDDWLEAGVLQRCATSAPTFRSAGRQPIVVAGS